MSTRLLKTQAAAHFRFKLVNDRWSWGGQMDAPTPTLLLLVHQANDDGNTPWPKIGPGRYRVEIAWPANVVGWDGTRPGAIERREHAELLRQGHAVGRALLIDGTRNEAGEFHVAPIQDDAPVWRLENVTLDGDGIYRADAVHPKVAA